MFCYKQKRTTQGPQGSAAFSPQSPLTPARDTHLGLTLLIMDWLEAKCLNPVSWPKQWHHLNKQHKDGGGGLASMLSAYFPPAEGHYLGKQSILSTMSMLILITMGQILWTKFNTIKNEIKQKTRKYRFIEWQIHKYKSKHIQLCSGQQIFIGVI